MNVIPIIFRWNLSCPPPPLYNAIPPFLPSRPFFKLLWGAAPFINFYSSQDPVKFGLGSLFLIERSYRETEPVLKDLVSLKYYEKGTSSFLPDLKRTILPRDFLPSDPKPASNLSPRRYYRYVSVIIETLKTLWLAIRLLMPSFTTALCVSLQAAGDNFYVCESLVCVSLWSVSKFVCRLSLCLSVCVNLILGRFCWVSTLTDDRSRTSYPF